MAHRIFKNGKPPTSGPRRGVTPVGGRTASEPLHVMLEPERMARYRIAQQASGLSMREWVATALDSAAAEQERGLRVVGSAATDGEGPPLALTNPSPNEMMLYQHGVQYAGRVRRLEAELAGLREVLFAGWQTHAASYKGRVIPLRAEQGPDGLAQFFEFQRTTPSWRMTSDGKLRRIGAVDDFDHGVIVATG